MMQNIMGNLLTQPIQNQLGIVGQFLTWRWASVITFGAIALAVLVIPRVYRKIRGESEQAASATGGGYEYHRLTESDPAEKPSELIGFVPVPITPSSEDTHLAGVYRTLLSLDYENRASRCLIQQHFIDWSRSMPRRGAGFLDFHWKVCSATVWTLTFSTPPTGHVTYTARKELEQGKMDRPLEWRDIPPLLVHKRGQWCALILRQFLPDAVVSELQSASIGDTFIFNFGDVRLVAKTTAPDGSEGKDWVITLPLNWEAVIPDIPRLT